MGGGTAVVEALARGRRAVGNDLNSLATFIVKAKTTSLNNAEVRAVRRWADEVVPRLSYWVPRREVEPFVDGNKTRNLELPCARFIKKLIAAALASIEALPTTNVENFIRCVLLRVGQWALDWRNSPASAEAFRTKLAATTHDMVNDLIAFMEQVRTRAAENPPDVYLFNEDAAQIHTIPIFAEAQERASLVVTSPPYPGVHVLYHRWQVDGRRETPAPYWIAGCSDGAGASFYNFGDRRGSGFDTYFEASYRTLWSIRRAMAPGAYMVQMLAFGEPLSQLPRYLENMRAAGFREVLPASKGKSPRRIWRDVPHRKWHASISGRGCSSREVVLVHRAV
jgi:hypothetical protein